GEACIVLEVSRLASNDPNEWPMMRVRQIVYVSIIKACGRNQSDVTMSCIIDLSGTGINLVCEVNIRWVAAGVVTSIMCSIIQFLNERVSVTEKFLTNISFLFPIHLVIITRAVIRCDCNSLRVR